MKQLLENWRKYLDEVEEIEPMPGLDTPAGRQASVDYFWDGGEGYIAPSGEDHEKNPVTGHPRFEKKNRRDIGSWEVAGLPMPGEIVTFEDPSGKDTFYFVVENEKPVFYVATEPYKDGVATGNVRKSGGGFKATDFYKWLVDQHGVIYSDTQQTPAGKKIWKWLKADLNVVEDGERERASK